MGDPEAIPDLATLQAFGLSGLAYKRLAQHPQRDVLRARYAQFAARHLALRQALASLLRAWNATRIEPVLFKGFALAEFSYPSAGQRPYADVDLLIDPDEVPPAFALAEQLGWQIVWRADVTDDVLAPHGAEYTGHEVGQIRHPGLDLSIDVHRRIVHNSHNRLPEHRSAARITAAVRAAAPSIPWEGTTIRVVSPADAVVVGLALNRCWGSDAWWLKPRDYADFEALAARHGVTPHTIIERAKELGVERTVRLYLGRCDPTQRRVDLRPPSWWSVRRWNLMATPERGPHDLLTAAMSLVDRYQATIAFIRMLPVARRAVRHARRGTLPTGWKQSGAGHAARTRVALDGYTWRILRRGIHRALRVLRVEATLHHAAMALAAYEVMQRHDLAVALRRDGTNDLELQLEERVVDLPAPPGVAGRAGDACASRSSRVDPTT